MAATIRVLGQVAPSAASETSLYTCATTSAVASSLWVCNTSSTTPDTFSVRVCVSGAADNIKQLLFYLVTIPPNTSLSIVAGLSLANTDVVKVFATNGTCSFR